ncbi:FAD-dependent oxidoreductase [Burkholderia gladioli]|uniref:FAD-dependent oxidoreductase n=1 Tax=Burkholderia gladioli TaxID=28095 RepID=UPI00163EE217|nr:FAD-dependent oxidoreductase [Burkholderia gladioli]
MAGDDFDVIVIGGGGAGLSAAVMAAETGARVLLVEAGARCGGATATSGGAIYAAGTKVQREAGIVDDTPDAMFTYAMALSRYRIEPSVMRRFCDAGSETLDWLIDCGVSIGNLSQSDVSDTPRSHWPVGGGARITEILEGRAQSAGVEIVTHTRVQKLVSENGAVVGIEVEGEVIKAKAIVVASGGFGANDELLARHYPSSQVEGRWYGGPATAQGDALTFGPAVGADLYGEDRGTMMMTSGLSRELTLPPGWLIFVNRLGRRFMDEGAAYCIQKSIMDAQPDQVAFAIFDQASFEDSPLDFRYAPMIRAGELANDWKRDTLDTGLRDGRLLRGETLSDLAAKAGIPAEALLVTVATYNADVAVGNDTLFFKNALHLRPLGDGPYYAAILKMRSLGLTSFGLRIDREARVQNASGQPIPGLYAAGEASGGAMGEIYLGSGNSVANAIVFGRIAGKNAGHFSQFST